MYMWIRMFVPRDLLVASNSFKSTLNRDEEMSWVLRFVLVLVLVFVIVIGHRISVSTLNCETSKESLVFLVS